MLTNRRNSGKQPASGSGPFFIRQWQNSEVTAAGFTNRFYSTLALDAAVNRPVVSHCSRVMETQTLLSLPSHKTLAYLLC